MQGKPPGWYKDPYGVATHEASWGGEKWIDTIRDPVTGKVRKDRWQISLKAVVWIAVGMSLFVILAYVFVASIY